MKTVLYGPVVLTGFFLLLPFPPPLLLFISPSFQAVERLARGERRRGRMDLQPGVRASPQGGRRRTQGLMGR